MTRSVGARARSAAANLVVAFEETARDAVALADEVAGLRARLVEVERLYQTAVADRDRWEARARRAEGTPVAEGEVPLLRVWRSAAEPEPAAYVYEPVGDGGTVTRRVAVTDPSGGIFVKWRIGPDGGWCGPRCADGPSCPVGILWGDLCFPLREIRGRRDR